MTDRLPDVAVVIPAYRAEAFIERSVASVLAQPDVAVECIVVVDGRLDRTVERLAAFPTVRVIVHETNEGAQRSRNDGLKAATAPFVMFLDADDRIEGPVLRSAVDRLAATGADCCFADCLCIGRRAGWLRIPRTTEPRTVLANWLRGGFVPPCAVIWRRQFVEQIGGWNEAIIKNQDGEIVFRALLADAALTFADAGHGVYVDEAVTGRTSKTFTRKVFRNHLAIMTWLHDRIRAKWGDDADLMRALSYQIYLYRRHTARHGFHDVYLELERLHRTVGFVEHHGDTLHRLLSGVLGLYWKERLATQTQWRGRGRGRTASVEP